MRTILASVTVALWLLVALAVAATIWVDESALSAAIGIGFWAIIVTSIFIGDTIDKWGKS